MAPFTTRRRSWWTVTPMLAVAALAVAGCSNSQESSDVEGTTPPVWSASPEPAGGSESGENESGSEGLKVDLKDPAGITLGTAVFADQSGHLQVTVEAHGLTPGFHGLHVHQVGKCEANSVAPTGGPAGNFLSAGGHLQVGGATSHPASGDLTSLEVRGDGSAKLVTTTDKLTIEDIKDKAVVVHADADNFGNIPGRYTRADGQTGPDESTLSTGDAGGRVACGVIQ
ncbi:superoxide dismutase[Cu-Zn] [Nocardia callitridis]|uniref:Superoxide dismutase [Cu-Zn] n=1 Tax=Nocardia callitridis TaxID=648753 RepID=A0ABP9K0J7_9NOCA